MKQLYTIPSAVLASVLLFSPNTQAGSLLLPLNNDPPNSSSGVLRPVRGMSMQTVLARFGEPEKRLAAVGEPPITRWVYTQFTVYFEGERTLHAVMNKK